MRIGKRLERVLALIDFGADMVVDVGTDHGFLALKAIEERGAKKVVATDISHESLLKAAELAKKYNYEDKIVCVHTDGLTALECDFVADVVVIAGIGGFETIKILKETLNKRNIKTYILQPMQDADVLREYLYSSGFKFVVDETVKDRDKFYHIIKCQYDGSKKAITAEDLVVGKTDKVVLGKDFEEFLIYSIDKLKSREKHLSTKEVEKLKIYTNYLAKIKAIEVKK